MLWRSQFDTFGPVLENDMALEYLHEVGLDWDEDSGLVPPGLVAELVAIEFAGLFHVSKQAMRIRLEDIGLVAERDMSVPRQKGAGPAARHRA